MAQKLKVVPESLYKKILSLNNDTEPELELQQKEIESKKAMLNKTQIPDDAKLLLYQDIARRVISSIMEEKRKPILVKNVVDASSPTVTPPKPPSSPTPPTLTPIVTPFSTPPSSPVRNSPPESPLSTVKGARVKRIVDYLEASGMIYYNQDQTLNLGDLKIKLSDMKGYIGILSSGIKRKPNRGLHIVLEFLREKKAPIDLFPPSIHKYLDPGRQSGGGNIRQSLLNKLINNYKQLY